MNINQAIIELYRFTKLNEGLLSYAYLAKIFGCSRSYVSEMAKADKDLDENKIALLEHRYNFSFFDRENAKKRLIEVADCLAIKLHDYEEFTLFDLDELVKLYNVNLNYILCGVGDMFIAKDPTSNKDEDLDTKIENRINEILEKRGL